MKWGIILYFFSMVLLTGFLAVYLADDGTIGSATAAPSHKSHS